MANGDRTRRKQEGEQPGLFDHIVAADFEGIDPPSMDSVPELQVHEPTVPQPGQTLAAWGDEDPSLTAPRAVETIDPWESVERKPEAIGHTDIAPPTEDAAMAPLAIDRAEDHEDASDSTLESNEASMMGEPSPVSQGGTSEHVVEDPTHGAIGAVDGETVGTGDPTSIDAATEESIEPTLLPMDDADPMQAIGSTEVDEQADADDSMQSPETPGIADTTESIGSVQMDHRRDRVEVVVEAAELPDPTDSTPDSDRMEVTETALPTAVSETASSPEAILFRRVEPSDTSGRAPVIALHGMPSWRSEVASDEPILSEPSSHAVAEEPSLVAAPLPQHGIWAWLELTRISNVLTVATNAMVGLWVAHLLAGQATMEQFIAWMPRHIGVVAGLCLLYLFGMVLNDLLDRDIDAHERPARPLPSGRVAMRPAILLAATLVATGVWLVGGGSFPVPGLAAIAIGLAFGSFAKGQRNAIQWLGEAWAVVGVGAILWNWLDHWRHVELRTPWGFEAVLLLVAAIVAYSLLHRTWRGSVVLMGLCRALAYWCATLSVMSVSGMQYNGSSVSAWGLVLFPGLIAFASTVAVSLLARDEAAPADDAAIAAPQPTRIWVRVLLVAAILVPWAFSPVVAGGARGMLQVMTIVALPMALFCGGIFLVKSMHAERAMRSHPTRITGGVAAWIAAICLLDASTLSVLGAPGLSIVALGCWWITRTAQRRVAGS